MRSLLIVALAAALALLAAGCGSQAQEDAAETIKSRELAALPDDPNFVGDPVITVECRRFTCIATLSSTEEKKIPRKPQDSWSISRGEPELQGGSRIVGFVAADAEHACMKQFQETKSVNALAPCTGQVARDNLP